MSNECNVNLVIKGWEGIPLAIERCGAITIYLPKVLRSFPDFLSCPETILNHLIFHELLHYNEPDLNLDSDKCLDKQFEIQNINILKEIIETGYTLDGQIVGYYVWRIV